MKHANTARACLYGALLLLSLWQCIACMLQSAIIPQPLAVLIHLSQIFWSHIAIHSAYSLYRILAGVLLAMLAGIPLGLCMGYFPRADRALSPLVYLSYPVPKIALLPVVMMLFGLGEPAKILMIFLIVVFQLVISVRDGVRSIPKEAYYPLYSLGAGYIDILREILIPAALPPFLTSLRIALATAISVLFFTETFGTTYGMGFFIMDAWMRVNYLEMFAGIMVLSGIGLALFLLIDWLEKTLCHWQYR